ncbi:SAM domain-containing protein SAMSN-1 isoform X1 [Ornithorhynchus anatinus]|nr:SAM domain-containing protein SAMSN-1 isoform X1 [Ornithorhynchus anatinus]
MTGSRILNVVSQEGSMDSLYEPIPEYQDDKEAISRREFPDLKNTQTKMRKSIQKSMSENEVFDRKNGDDTSWKISRKSEGDQSITRPCQFEDLSGSGFLEGNNKNILQGGKREDAPCQATESDGIRAESMGTLKRLQKLVRNKKANAQSFDEVKYTLQPLSPAEDTYLSEEEEVPTSCMKLTKSQEKKVGKDNARRKEEPESRLDFISMTLGRSHPSGASHSEGILTHSKTEFQGWNDWESFPGYSSWTDDFWIPLSAEWENCAYCTRQPQFAGSPTDIDLPYSWRSSSFGNFDRFRNHSVSKPDDSPEICEVEVINEGEQQGQHKGVQNGGSLGKKMRAISWTMKKRMGKKYIKALSEEKNEEEGEDTYSYRISDPGVGLHTEVSLKASDSLDSLYSGQSSSSGVTSCSDGTSNRDSLRLDDEVPFTGPFCGRARVHTDFTPSPYDTDSLKIKKGDIIDIISKTPMGMWTGMLNNKVGNFKFIYVDIILEEEATPRKIRPHRRSKRAKPKTLQEFLERIHLQEYASTLLLNGYESLEDLKYITESHLVELNIVNPEDRMRLLSAAENLLDDENGQEQENEPAPLSLSPDRPFNKSQLNDCPRDSGCYISSENSDNGKEDVESENLSDMVQKISITETSD